MERPSLEVENTPYRAQAGSKPGAFLPGPQESSAA
jgi:hypothetical protein